MSDTSMYEIAKDISKDIKTDSLEYLEFYNINLNDANSNVDFKIESKKRKTTTCHTNHLLKLISN